MCRDQFTKHCGRPEISGKIGNFIVFNALSDTATMDIVAKFVKEELKNYELRLVRIDEGLMLDFLKHQTKYGARGILFTKDKSTIIKEGGYDSFGIISSLCFVLKKQQI